MWTKLHHQSIKEGSLLINRFDKKDLYNKNLINSFVVKKVDGNNYELENFMMEPNLGLPETPYLVVPIDFSLTYDELVKAHWHLWIE